jgi:hypothetical protein
VLDEVLVRANTEVRRRHADPKNASDTEVELAFFRSYRAFVLRRFYDRLLPIFETCLESDECPGWPRVERIVLYGRESIYGEARYNRIAESSLAPTIVLCGVRMGTDKLTHLFSNGFFYYNASRQKGSRLSTDEDVRRAALADERGLMGARSTEVISPADAEATLGGFRLARDHFEGDNPTFAREESTGLLQRRRDVDVCAYVTPEWDEGNNPPTFTASSRKIRRLREAIAEREAQNEAAERSLSESEESRLKGEILARRLPPDHGRLAFLVKLSIALKWGFAYLTLPDDSWRAISYLVFPTFRLSERRPIVLRHEGAREGSVRQPVERMPGNEGGLDRPGRKRDPERFSQGIDVGRADVAVQVPEQRAVVKPAVVHFAERFVLRPTLDDDAIERQDRAGPIGALLAVNQKRPVGPVGQDQEGLEDPVVPERPGGHRNVQELQGGLSGLPAVRVAGPQVQNGLDAKLLELGKTGRIGLRAPEEIRLDPEQVPDVGPRDLGGPGCRARRSRGVRAGRKKQAGQGARDEEAESDSTVSGKWAHGGRNKHATPLIPGPFRLEALQADPRTQEVEIRLTIRTPMPRGEVETRATSGRFGCSLSRRRARRRS